MICSCLAQRVGSRDKKQLATATLPASGNWASVRPNSATRERRKEWGSWMSTPAPSPVVGSAPAAPPLRRAPPRRAAMLEIVECLEGEIDDVVARVAVQARDAGDATGVVLE